MATARRRRRGPHPRRPLGRPARGRAPRRRAAAHHRRRGHRQDHGAHPAHRPPHHHASARGPRRSSPSPSPTRPRREMAERVDQLIPYGYAETWIGTFHAFGDRVLREGALEVGPQPGVPRAHAAGADHLPARAALAAAPRALPAARRSRPGTSPRCSTLVSRAKDEDVSPAALPRVGARRRGRSRGHDRARSATRRERHLELAAFYETLPAAARRGGRRRLRRPDLAGPRAPARAAGRCWPSCARATATSWSTSSRTRTTPSSSCVRLLAGDGRAQHHRGRRRRPGHLPLARRGRREPARLPPLLPGRARGGAHREPPLDPGDPRRGRAAHLLQQPVPAGGHRRASTSACARRGRTGPPVRHLHYDTVSAEADARRRA